MNRPIVFADFHHTSLLKSLVFLFEKRLGGTLVRPIGMEWYYNGFWRINDQVDTAKQFLQPGNIPTDGTPQLNNSLVGEGQLFEQCEDPEIAGEYLKAVTFEQFKKMDIDFVIASIPQHIEPFRRLIQEYKPNAKLIVQVGNAWTLDQLKEADNILASSLLQDVSPSTNLVTYHQEFDTNIFRPENWIVYRNIPVESPIIQTSQRKISSFINILQHTPDYPIFQQLEQRLTGWELKTFGGQCRDGCITGSANLAHEIRSARFIYHIKNGGDGYGHILHNAIACGRPVIYKSSDYNGKLGQRILIDGISGIDVEGLSIDGIIEKINHYNEESNYRNLCRNVYSLFMQVVDFNKEIEDIKQFLQHLK